MTDKSAATINNRIPRGVRNNNPGNIKYDVDNKWLGCTGKDFGGFAIFVNPVYGVRALIHTLRNYRDKDGCRTATDFITRWDGATDAHVNDYIAYIERNMTLNPVQQIDSGYDIQDLAYYIVQFENGMQPYTLTLYTMAAGL